MEGEHERASEVGLRRFVGLELCLKAQEPWSSGVFGEGLENEQQPQGVVGKLWWEGAG